MNFYLKETDKEILLNILNKYRVDFNFFVFGSRVDGSYKDFSDLDILVERKTDTKLYKLKNELEESNITIKVDIIDSNLVDEDFRKIISSNKIKI